MNEHTKQVLDNAARNIARTALESVDHSDSGFASGPIYKGVPPTFAYHQPGSAPTIISKSGARYNGDDEFAPTNFSLCRLVKSMAAGNDMLASNEWARISKSQSVSDDSLGGALLPAEVLTGTHHIHELAGLDPFLALQVPEIFISGDSVAISKSTAGVSGSWTVENAEIDPENLELGQVRLQLRQWSVVIAISNRLLQDSSEAAEKVLRADLTRAAKRARTTAFLNGAGGVEPVGIVNHLDVTTRDTVTAANLSIDDLMDMVKVTEEMDSQTSGFLMTPSLSNILRKERDPVSGAFMWSSTLDEYGLERLMSRPVAMTTAAKNPSAPTTHYIVAANWQDEILIGSKRTLEIAVSQHVRFLHDQTVLRATLRTDLALRHPSAVVVLPVSGVS